MLRHGARRELVHGRVRRRPRWAKTDGADRVGDRARHQRRVSLREFDERHAERRDEIPVLQIPLQVRETADFARQDQRLDLAHKVSADLASEYSTVVFEELHIPSMVKNHSLASAIMDASCGQLRRLTAYKVERRGGRVILVEPRGTSQRCSGCGEVVPKGLSERVHDCPNCKLVLDRDVNAARNVLAAGLEQARAEEQPLLVQRRRTSKFAPVKQEAYGFSRR